MNLYGYCREVGECLPSCQLCALIGPRPQRVKLDRVDSRLKELERELKQLALFDLP